MNVDHIEFNSDILDQIALTCPEFTYNPITKKWSWKEGKDSLDNIPSSFVSEIHHTRRRNSVLEDSNHGLRNSPFTALATINNLDISYMKHLTETEIILSLSDSKEKKVKIMVDSRRLKATSFEFVMPKIDGDFIQCAYCSERIFQPPRGAEITHYCPSMNGEKMEWIVNP